MINSMFTSIIILWQFSIDDVYDSVTVKLWISMQNLTKFYIAPLAPM